MSYKSNKWLEKYEIKGPDYDVIARKPTATQDNGSYPVARFGLSEGIWTQAKKGFRLFTKKKARLMFTGDITCFEKQLYASKIEGGYDFSPEFKCVKPVFAQADLVVGNLETMIVPEAPYRTEKYVAEQNFHCNAPIEFLSAVRDAGFDVLTNANNHDLDTGAIGIGETIDHIERLGFIHTGTFKTDKKRFELFNINRITFAIIAFATEHNNKRCNLTEEGANFLLNNYSEETAEVLISEAKAAGAMAVFCCIHWGTENKPTHNKAQERIAQQLADAGCDCIIGSHPHVLQEFVYTESNGKKVPTFYSMGNFISHNSNNPKARTVIAVIDIESNRNGVSIAPTYIPLCTAYAYKGVRHVVLPIKATDKENKANRAKLNRIKKTLGEGIQICENVRFDELLEDSIEQTKEARQQLILDEIESFPFIYDDGKIVYSINEASIDVAGLSPSATSSSYSIGADLQGRKIQAIQDDAFAGNGICMKLNISRIVSIGNRAFKEASALEGFQCGNALKSIGDEAFRGCRMLSCAVIKNNVENIGSKAFADCENLRSVKIPTGVTGIADDAFSNCPKAIFYCSPGSYGFEYAKRLGYKVVEMNLEP